ncbi:MAG: HAD-IA family hydrolase [Nocardioidaceae bacterium]
MTPTRLAADALLFDNDGVLVDSGEAVERAWLRVASTYGLDADALMSQVHGRPSRATIDEFVDPPRRAEALALVDRLELEWGDLVRPIPGAVDCVSSLPAGRWAIVTSGTTALSTTRLRAAGVPVPPTLVTADDVRRGKPHPDPYLAAAAGLGVAPGRCVVFEDAAAGVAAARAAGVRWVVGVGPAASELEVDAAVADLRPVRFDGAAVVIERSTA